MKNKTTTISSFLALLLIGCGAEETGEKTVETAWTFSSGDCASNDVTTVRVIATPQSGPELSGEFPCEDGTGVLGELPDGPSSFSISAEGSDADGVVRAENFGQTTSFPDGRALGPINVTLHPKSSNVVVSWSTPSGACPQGVTIPFFVTVYELPAEDGGELTESVAETQETCTSGQATLMRVAPGDYVVEVDTRAVTPDLSGTSPVTVVAGEDAEVSVEME